jgi:hypothetical protein
MAEEVSTPQDQGTNGTFNVNTVKGTLNGEGPEIL